MISHEYKLIYICDYLQYLGTAYIRLELFETLLYTAIIANYSFYVFYLVKVSLPFESERYLFSLSLK